MGGLEGEGRLTGKHGETRGKGAGVWASLFPFEVTARALLSIPPPHLCSLAAKGNFQEKPECVIGDD